MLITFLVLSIFSAQASPSTSIDALIKEKAVRKISDSERKELVSYFVNYSHRWGVPPLLSACVAWKESTFKKKTRPWKSCKWVKPDKLHRNCWWSKDKSGNLKQKEGLLRRCCWRKPEVGMMQIIPRERTTKDGFKLCTGRRRWKSHRELRNVKTNICIGTYELSQKRQEIKKYISWYKKRNRLRYCKWYNKRYWSKRHRKFFKRKPYLLKYFWVAAYNWGCCRFFNRNRNVYDTVGYPLRVLRCFDNYSRIKSQHRNSGPIGKKKKVSPTEQKKIKYIITFAYASRKISKGDIRTLRGIAKLARANKKTRIEIKGYTDYIGTYTGNIRLSRKRARRIYNLLNYLKVPKKIMTYKGMGEINPIASNRTKVGRAKNRRVEIILRSTEVENTKTFKSLDNNPINFDGANTRTRFNIFNKQRGRVLYRLLLQKRQAASKEDKKMSIQSSPEKLSRQIKVYRKRRELFQKKFSLYWKMFRVFIGIQI